jgi:multidrug resistance efflux pump
MSEPHTEPSGNPATPAAGGNGSTATATTAAPPAPEKPARRKMKRSTRIALLVVLVVAVLIAAGITATYFINSRNYVTTDNAQIDGDKISINAPTSGTLIDWRATQGTEVHKDEVVGRIKIQGGFVQPQQSIRAPGDATVVVDNGVEGAFVPAGTQLAVAYNYSRIFVTARVDETDIDSVRPGQQVDISVDAYPDATITGTVSEIQGGAAGVFSLFPQANTSGNFQKVTQVIPVKINIDDPKGLDLVPGMNVTVKIRRG